ncbi:MAG TPA: TRAP transporter large permease [Xanthobacteraceae bacterium]|jgi:C4-dicarboxylate transporter DctM subunit
MSTLVFVIFLCLFLALRIEIAFALGLGALLYMVVFLPTVSLTTIPQQMYAGADSFTLTAIPFFVLVGELMTAGGISRRLVDFSHTLVGHLKGGMGIVELVASLIFAGFSGSAVANAAGTGSITIPAMIQSGYPRGLAAAIESSSSSLGAILPPSIPLIVYASIAGVSVSGLFLGSYVPGAILSLGLAILIRWEAIRHRVPMHPRASRAEKLAAAKDAAPALLTPLLIMVGIFGGVMTPTEAGAAGAVYAFLISYFLYREITLYDLPRLLLNTAITTGVVMLVMTAAAVFSWILAFEGIPADAAELFLSTVRDPSLLMISIVALLLVMGIFIEPIPGLIILTPVIVPIGAAAGLDPLHLGVVVTIALTLGILTPPVGVILYVTSMLANTTVEATSRALIPFLVVLIGGTLLIAVVPGLVLWLPRLFGY